MKADFTIDDVRQVVAEATTAAHSPWFDNDSAAVYLGCKPGTMKVWRSRGEGPRYHVIQNKMIRYHIDQLDAFARGEVSDDV